MPATSCCSFAGSYLRVHGTGGAQESEPVVRPMKLHQIHLQPFGYLEAAQFHQRWSLAHQTRASFLIGRPDAVPALPGRHPVHRRQHPATGPRRVGSVVPRTDVPISARSLARSHPSRRSSSRLLRGMAAFPASRTPLCFAGRNLHYYNEQLVTPRLPAAAVPARAPPSQSEAGAIRRRRPAASIPVPFRVSQHEHHPKRRCRQRIRRADCAVSRCLVWGLLSNGCHREPAPARL